MVSHREATSNGQNGQNGQNGLPTPNPILHPLLFGFRTAQSIVDSLLSPKPPNEDTALSRPKVAVIGAGITGVTAAAHIIGHGFDTVIFESGPDVSSLGGIWSRVNSTSSLQIHSLMYRFHPSVRWDRGYPDREQILSQVRELWRRYELEDKTRFGVRVNRVYQDEQGRWIINDPSHGRFDGIIAAVGTCGAPKMPRIAGMDKFHGAIHHSSRLTGKCDVRGKTMIVIGGGASAVEALEFAHAEGAKKVYILARSDKWIIPRHPVWDVLLSLNIFGQETPLSLIPETLLRKMFYRDLEDMAPPPDASGKHGLFTDTPMVSSDVMEKLRSGQAKWIRCDVVGFAENGVRIRLRDRGVPSGGPGRPSLVEGDVVVMATGFERPQLSFLPRPCFEEPYAPPNWYLQTFPTEHPSVSCINCTYSGAIGTVGNWHIGIYTRMLLMFLVDPLTRPSSFWTKRWVDMTRLLKASSPVGPFDFFTYLELVWWLVFCIAFNPFRWKWALFVFLGVGSVLPARVVGAEDRMRNGLGMGRLVNGERGGGGADVGTSL